MPTMRLRAAPTYWGKVRVDRKNLMLYDTVAMKANVEALGHNVMTDMKSIQMVAALANQHRGGLGVQGRFGHPGASENSAGRKVMVSKNFRVVGDALLHDVQLIEAARKSPAFAQDPLEYIMDVAEDQPEEIAESAVLATDLVWTLADGSEVPFAGYIDDEESIQRDRPTSALTPLPIMRPTTLYYLDVVNEGALTHNGLFSSDVAQAMFMETSNDYAQQLFELVDDWRGEYDIPLEALPGKVNQIVGQYLTARGATMGDKTKPTNAGAQGRGSRAVSQKLDTAAPNEPVLNEDELTPDGEAEVETTEVDPPAEDALAQAEADVEQAAQTAEQPAAPAATEALGADQRDQRILTLETTVNRLVNLAVKQSALIKQLSADIKRIDGEPIVTQRLGTFSQARGLSAGAPPKALTSKTPTGISERAKAPQSKSGKPEDQEGLAVLNANNARQQR